MKVDFFIVGAPKSGTTALRHYLNKQESVYFPEQKEIYYFGSDLTYKIPRKTWNDYLENFIYADSQQIKGDATISNLISVNAAKEIYDFNSDAKIIIMIRNPVDLIYSWFYEMKFVANENVRCFEEAFDLSEARSHGLFIPQKISCPIEFLDYKRMGTLSTQIERYLEVFGNNQVRLILYDDFKDDTSRVYDEVLHFLGLTKEVSPNFEIINSNKFNRIQFVQRFLKYMPEWGKKFSRVIIPHKRLRKQIYMKLFRWNTVYQNRPEMKQETRQHLTTYFQPEIEKLERLLDKDLSHWK